MNGERIREADETMGRFLFVPFLLKEKGPPPEAKKVKSKERMFWPGNKPGLLSKNLK